jgi:hypothetical protein
VDLRSAVVADEQALEVMQPREGALDDPAHAAQSRSMPTVAAGDLRSDAASAQLTPLRPVVVGAVGGEALGSAVRPATAAAHRRHGVDERDQLGDVVAIAGRERPGERDAAGVDEEVVLGAGSGPVNWARARLGAPFFACT